MSKECLNADLKKNIYFLVFLIYLKVNDEIFYSRIRHPFLTEVSFTGG